LLDNILYSLKGKNVFMLSANAFMVKAILFSM